MLVQCYAYKQLDWYRTPAAETLDFKTPLIKRYIELLQLYVCWFEHYVNYACVLTARVSLGVFLSIAHVTILRPRQNCCHFADISKYIFLKVNVWILLRIPLKFVSMVQINIVLALVQIMGWCRPGDKPLSETMMMIVLTQICVTRPPWITKYFPCYAK